jgi:hypothetical protein
MNERIKLLEQQCWGHRVDGVLVDGHLHFDTQKFAELIIRECADIAMREDHDPAECIKKYFGVEE